MSLHIDDLSSDDEDDDLFDKLLLDAHGAITNGVLACVQSLTKKKKKKRTVDHRTLPRRNRRKFFHEDALRCINRDYLGNIPIFDMKEFETMFRLSRPRFQRLMEDIGNSENKFFTNKFSKQEASLEARLLLPLKVLAYGVPTHCFNDYFQMSMTMSRECVIQFDIVMKKLYEGEYLRLPTTVDLKSIVLLHNNTHEIDGMFGSLDCMHTYWKNCPKAWEGQFKGKEERASIVLEGIADYHMWFWHASYGYAGTLNDLNILNLSPFLESLTDGSFAELEKSVVPYKIGNEVFEKLFILVDGIYPNYSRFVKPISSPSGDEQSNYTAWQEACRKDIERAFGKLQCQWQWVQRPIMQHKLKDISSRLATCLILHNMLVSDRVMEGDVYATYDPSNNVIESNLEVNQSNDAMQQQTP